MSTKPNNNNTAYGFINSLQTLSPLPIIAKRIPTYLDSATLGTVWVYSSGSGSRIFIFASTGNWVELETSAGSGIFSSLIVNGTTNLNGALTVASGTGAINISADTAVTSLNIGTGSAAKTISIGNLIGTTAVDISYGTGGMTLTGESNSCPFNLNSGGGVINIGTDEVSKTINIGSPTNNDTTINIGNSNNASSHTIGIYGGNGEITIETASNITITSENELDINTASNDSVINIGTNNGSENFITMGCNGYTSNINLIASGTGTGINLNANNSGRITLVSQVETAAAFSVTNNAPIGTATLTGQTLTMGSSQVITLTNSYITTSKPVMLNISNLNVSTNGAYLTVEGVIQSSGSLAIKVTNNGTGNLASTDTIIIGFIVLG